MRHGYLRSLGLCLLVPHPRADPRRTDVARRFQAVEKVHLAGADRARRKHFEPLVVSEASSTDSRQVPVPLLWALQKWRNPRPRPKIKCRFWPIALWVNARS